MDRAPRNQKGNGLRMYGPGYRGGLSISSIESKLPKFVEYRIEYRINLANNEICFEYCSNNIHKLQ